MKVLVLTGSHRKNGNSSALANQFIQGAQKAGHDVKRMDCAFLKVGGCMGCDYCQAHNGECVQKDDYVQIRDEIIAADAIVLASPVYYFGMSSQIKAVIDRFYAINDKIMGASKKAALLLAMGDTNMETAAPSCATYQSICGYLGWENHGIVVASAYTEGSVSEEALKEAYDLGSSL